jgi:hypothetical protein
LFKQCHTTPHKQNIKTMEEKKKDFAQNEVHPVWLQITQEFCVNLMFASCCVPLFSVFRGVFGLFSLIGEIWWRVFGLCVLPLGCSACSFLFSEAVCAHLPPLKLCPLCFSSNSLKMLFCTKLSFLFSVFFPTRLRTVTKYAVFVFFGRFFGLCVALWRRHCGVCVFLFRVLTGVVFFFWIGALQFFFSRFFSALCVRFAPFLDSLSARFVEGFRTAQLGCCCNLDWLKKVVL